MSKLTPVEAWSGFVGSQTTDEFVQASMAKGLQSIPEMVAAYVADVPAMHDQPAPEGLAGLLEQYINEHLSAKWDYRHLSDKAKQVVHLLHHESHQYGKCDCGLTEEDGDNTLHETWNEFGPAVIEAAANDDVEAILKLRHWFELPALV